VAVSTLTAQRWSDAGDGAHQHQKAVMAANDKSGFWND
jgi:hypothetical protein